MAIATVDTLKLSKTLKATGLTDDQAEVLASAFAEMVQVNFKDLATKDEVERLATMIDQLARSFKAELDQHTRSFKAELDQHTRSFKTELDRLATKEELDRVVNEFKSELERTKTELKRDIADVRTEFKSEMKLLKTELMNEINSKHDKTQSDIYHIKWMSSVSLTLTVAVLGVLARMLLFPTR